MERKKKKKKQKKGEREKGKEPGRESRKGVVISRRVVRELSLALMSMWCVPSLCVRF